jgi:BirA family biotin operon repressor/biotin-[acetyl-CoA-carboxylase] ligase
MISRFPAWFDLTMEHPLGQAPPAIPCQWQNQGMESPEKLTGQILAILSDGVARAASSLAAQSEADESVVRAALGALEDAGLPLLRDGSDRLYLERSFIALDAQTIRDALEALGRKARVEVAGIIDSTNTALLRRARDSASPRSPDELHIVVAEMQTAGRGRQGRTWSTQAGSSLAVSFSRLLLRGIDELAGLSLMCGLAVRDALTRHAVEALLKWPNDLLWQGRKLGGILIEVHPIAAGQSVVVIGVGLNVAADPVRSAALALPGTGGLIATDLEAAGALAPVNRNRLIADLADTLSERIDQFLHSGFGPYREDWNAQHAYRDLAVEMIDRGNVVHQGVARGVDAQGRLCLEAGENTLTVIAGDVTLRVRK